MDLYTCECDECGKTETVKPETASRKVDGWLILVGAGTPKDFCSKSCLVKWLENNPVQIG